MARITKGLFSDAFSGQTARLDASGSDVIKNEVVANSRAQYSTPLVKVEKHMNKLFNPEKTTHKQTAKSKPKPRQKSTPESKKKIYGL